MASLVTLENRIPMIIAELPTRTDAIAAAAAEEIATDAAAGAPEGATGELKASISAESVTVGMGERGFGVVAAFYWIFNEFGTVTGQPPRPFMIPAVERTRVNVGNLGRAFFRSL